MTASTTPPPPFPGPLFATVVANAGDDAPAGDDGFVVTGASRPSLILLHGFLGSGRNLRTLALKLVERQPHLPLLLPDLRGHGQSPGLHARPASVARDPNIDADADAAGASLAALAADVLATARNHHNHDHNFPPPYHFIGHSLGGRVALAAAGLAPAEISHVTLLDIGPGPIDPGTSDTRPVLDALLAAPAEASDRRAMRAALTTGGLAPRLADWLLMNLVIEDKRVRWNIDRAVLEDLHSQSMRENLWPIVHATKVPLRCIRGGRSRYVSDDEATRLEAAGCPVDVLPDAGHFVHVDALEPLVDLLVADLPVT